MFIEINKQMQLFNKFQTPITLLVKTPISPPYRTLHSQEDMVPIAIKNNTNAHPIESIKASSMPTLVKDHVMPTAYSLRTSDRLVKATHTHSKRHNKTTTKCIFILMKGPNVLKNNKHSTWHWNNARRFNPGTNDG